MKLINDKPVKVRGRPRSFDRSAALECAMDLFWRQGYEATSLNDLTGAMGISPPSLYAAFGDKERLFLEAVERYRLNMGSAGCPFADEPTARGGIERLLKYNAEVLTSPSHPRGCMLITAAANCSASSVHLQAALAQHRAESKTRIRARIDQGGA